jgi:hypothetical protein
MWFMGSAYFFTEQWHLEFNPNAETLIMAPLYVRLLNLPFEMWNPKSLEAIGKGLNNLFVLVKPPKVSLPLPFIAYV